MGIWNVDALMDAIPCTLLAEWQAFYRVHPWGERRADLRAGIVSSTMANLWSKARHQPRDFMIDFDSTTRGQMTDADIKAQAKSLFKTWSRRKRHGVDR